MKTYTKEGLIEELKGICNMGWVKSTRQNNDGAVGNTLEDLLGIEENNLPIPNASEWELKAQRMDTTSLLPHYGWAHKEAGKKYPASEMSFRQTFNSQSQTDRGFIMKVDKVNRKIVISFVTLFHSEPSPRAMRFVPQILLPHYGWVHKEAGKKYPASEMSFRQTFNSQSQTDRGFIMKVDKANRKIVISFDAKSVNERHGEWLRRVEESVGLEEIEPQPYWGFDDLFHKVGTKLLNCFFVLADRKRTDGEEYFHYKHIKILKDLSSEKFVSALENGAFYVDFDARTGHNHGTKFRMRRNWLPNLYDEVVEVT